MRFFSNCTHEKPDHCHLSNMFLSNCLITTVKRLLLIVIRSNYNDTVSKFLIQYVVIFDFGMDTTSK